MGGYTNLAAFLLTTLFYYLALKPATTPFSTSTSEAGTEPQNEPPSPFKYLAIYCLLTIIVQFIINTSVIVQMCGGAITQNIAYAGFITFVPWVLIFGVLIAVMMIWPSFKAIFSNVFGYYFVASSANKVLTELLINKDIQTQIDADASISTDEKAGMQNAADMIIKICGNTSVLINQLTPDNFMEYWNLLTPLMKSQYQGAATQQAQDLQRRLYELVATKDNIGEATWFIYTGILLTSLVQMKITSRGCINNSAQQQAAYSDFLAKEKENKDKQTQAQSTVYTLSS
jgi:hypothetical protein